MSLFNLKAISNSVHKLHENYLRLPYDAKRYEKIKSLLFPEEIELINKVEKYYAKVNADQVREQFQNIAKELIQLPFIHSAYGIGFPFYGNVDMKVRIFDSMVRYRLGDIDSEKFKLSILPDYDIFLVYVSEPSPTDLEMNAPGFLDQNFDHDFINMLSKNRGWKDARLKLLNFMGVATHQNDNQKYIYDFQKNGLLPLDIVPVPMHFWEKIPYFCQLEDFSKIRFLRDLMLTGVRVTSSDNVLYIPKWYRLHVILRTFYYRWFKYKSEDNPQELNILPDWGFTHQELMNKIFDYQPHANMLSVFPEAREELTARYSFIISYALSHEYLKQEKNNLLVITPKGVRYIESVLKKREYLIKHPEYFSNRSQFIFENYNYRDSKNFYSMDKKRNPFGEDIF